MKISRLPVLTETNRGSPFMSQCDACHIMEKLYQCCGRHPLTGSKVKLKLVDGTLVTACPHLDIHSRCSIYESRPLGCRQFICDWHNTAENLEHRKVLEHRFFSYFSTRDII